MREPLESLEADLAACGRGTVVVLTGAGVSRASGLATFRGTEPDAIWRRDDVEKATRRHFDRHPVDHWRWYLRRFAALDAARPNPAHRAIVELEEWQTGRGGGFLLVTQNIDTLHEQAGSRRVAKVHGSSDRLRCTAPPCRLAAPAGSLPRAPEIFERFLAEPRRRHLPLCPECGCALRAHVLLFDEHYQEHLDYRFDETVEALSRADLLVFVGTSFSVGITDLALRLALGRRVPVYSIDPGAAGPPVAGVISIPRPAEEALPEVVGQLAGGREETA